jgi:hypothetical protein
MLEDPGIREAPELRATSASLTQHSKLLQKRVLWKLPMPCSIGRVTRRWRPGLQEVKSLFFNALCRLVIRIQVPCLCSCTPRILNPTHKPLVTCGVWHPACTLNSQPSIPCVRAYSLPRPHIHTRVHTPVRAHAHIYTQAAEQKSNVLEQELHHTKRDLEASVQRQSQLQLQARFRVPVSICEDCQCKKQHSPIHPHTSSS